jgi:hypothetical protein
MREMDSKSGIVKPLRALSLKALILRRAPRLLGCAPESKAHFVLDKRNRALRFVMKALGLTVVQGFLQHLVTFLGYVKIRFLNFLKHREHGIQLDARPRQSEFRFQFSSIVEQRNIAPILPGSVGRTETGPFGDSLFPGFGEEQEFELELEVDFA